MELHLNDLLNFSEEEINNSKIEFNMQAGSGGQPIIDRWLKHTEEEKTSGTCKECSFWGWYGSKQRNFYPGQVVFSFARIYHTHVGKYDLVLAFHFFHHLNPF